MVALNGGGRHDNHKERKRSSGLMDVGRRYEGGGKRRNAWH